LDVIEIPLHNHSPLTHQTENYVIDSSQSWRRVGIVTWNQVQASVDAVLGELWLNGHSTFYGNNDKVPKIFLSGIADSLKLVRVQNFTLRVAYEPGYQGAQGAVKVRGSFTLNGHHYRLSVTDPFVTGTYLQRPQGDYPIGSATLCISLSEPIHGHAFKLIAAVFTAHRCNGIASGRPVTDIV
jgi:hypothetical protein